MTYAFVFPGQGSQSQGMLGDLADNYSQVKDTFAEASEVLGYDLWQIVKDNPDNKLNQTEITQPAMLVAGVAVSRVWASLTDTHASICAGHSLGEYTALVYSGALKFSDAVALVAARGRYMQSAVAEGEGAMAAVIGLNAEQVINVCGEAAQGEVLSAVNFNSLEQVVIAGQADAVQRAIVVAKEQGAKLAVPLSVSVPSHCLLMQPAANQLAEYLSHIEITTPAIPVLHNVDVKSYDQADEIKAILVKQLYSPVYWVDTIKAMQAADTDMVIEMGPGKVLMGLNRRIDRKLASATVFDTTSLNATLEKIA